MAHGCSARSLLDMTSASIAPGPVQIASAPAPEGDAAAPSPPHLPGLPVDASEVVAEALAELLSDCLPKLLPKGGDSDSPTGPGGAEPEGPEAAHALQQLRGVMRCLSATATSPEGNNSTNAEEEAEMVVGLLRDTAWSLLQDGVDRLGPAAYSRAAVVEVLDMMGGVASQQVRAAPACACVRGGVGGQQVGANLLIVVRMSVETCIQVLHSSGIRDKT